MFDGFHSPWLAATLFNRYTDGNTENPQLVDSWREDFTLIVDLAVGSRVFDGNLIRNIFKQELYKEFSEKGAEYLLALCRRLASNAPVVDDDDSEDDEVEAVADASLQVWVAPSSDLVAIRLARCADNDDTEMNSSTKIMFEWAEEQYGSITDSYALSTGIWSPLTAFHVYDFAQESVEDNSDDFDEQYYQVFYADRKSACVNWCLIAKKVNEIQTKWYADYYATHNKTE